MFQECRGFIGENAGGDFDAVVELRMVEDGETGADGAAFHVICAVDEAGDARLDHSPGAHGAGLDGDVESRVEEAVIFDFLRGGAEGDDFGVGGGVAIGDGTVAGAGDDAAFVDDDGTDGDFTAIGGEAGFFQRGLHEGDVSIRDFGHRAREYHDKARAT